MAYKKKLVEVALPLDAINAGAAQEKNPFLKDHPRSMHLWWARRPLTTCRAVIFASLVDDPSCHPEQFPTEDAQERERERLFGIIERLVKWENSNSEDVLAKAKAEILKSTDGNPPPVLDPFCGGGSIPLEAQRLGLTTYASDLNPVAVLITKALIEIPPRFSGRSPITPESRQRLHPDQSWPGARGLAADLRYYARRMRDEAKQRIGHLYPKARLPKKYGNGEAPVIAWLWARTVKCPNPVCGAEMPLVRSLWLSTRKGGRAWLRPVVDRREKAVRFEVESGEGTPPDGTVRNRAAQCLVCGETVSLPFIRERAQAGAMGATLLGLVAEVGTRRAYLPADEYHARVASGCVPAWQPDEMVTTPCHDVDRLPMYGMRTWGDAFTQRQLVALTTYCDLLADVWNQIRHDALSAGWAEDDVPLAEGGAGALAYADAITTYLAFSVDHLARYSCTLATWNNVNQNIAHAFGRQALQMVWDFAECNAVDGLSPCTTAEWVAGAFENTPVGPRGVVRQLDAAATTGVGVTAMVCTDPPYYDNISYADISDFFYVWLRRALGRRYPDILSTVLTPKAQEIVAASHRLDGDRRKAQAFFEHGLSRALAQIRSSHRTDYPFTVFYAFKQSESTEDGNGESATSSTGWETMLEALLSAEFTIVGTWPVRTERDQGLKTGSNALASSIVLVCRVRAESAGLATRREFIAALRRELPDALLHMMEASIAPVDLAQASIGPGMAIFSRYAKVLEADGSPMSVRTALQVINQELDAHLAAQEGELDNDTRFCVAWFEQYGMGEGPFGEADVLARARNTAVNGLADAGVADSRAGKVRLLKRAELPAGWDPIRDQRLTTWEATQHLIRRLEEGGERAAAALCAQLGSWGANAHGLAYRLYNICERKGWADDARAYNSLVVSWPNIIAGAGRVSADEQQQMEM